MCASVFDLVCVWCVDVCLCGRVCVILCDCGYFAVGDSGKCSDPAFDERNTGRTTQPNTRDSVHASNEVL